MMRHILVILHQAGFKRKVTPCFFVGFIFLVGIFFSTELIGQKVNDPIGSELSNLHKNFLKTGKATGDDIFQIVGENVLIEIVAKEGKKAKLIKILSKAEYGLISVLHDDSDDIMKTGLFPIANLKKLNHLPELINYVRPAYPPILNSGIVNSQGDKAIGSDLVRTGFGFSGAGVKVGVIADSYNTVCCNQAATDMFNGDLPGPGNFENSSPVSVLREYPFGPASDEGRAMLQVIHDISPKADLVFRTGNITEGDLANGIIELQQAGCNVIVDDVHYITEPFFIDGPVAQAVDLVAAQGVTYIASAGNYGSKSYENIYNANPPPAGITGSAHGFGPGDIYQGLTLSPGSYTVVLQWEDNWASTGGASNDLDIYLTDEAGNIVVGFNRNNIGGDPIEVLQFTISSPDTKANFLITRAAGTQAVKLKYVVFRGTQMTIDEYQFPSSTIVGHANAVGAITVGAVRYGNTPAYGVNPPTAEPFSSLGGTIVNGNPRHKPDFMAPDGVNTTVNLGAPDIESDGFPNFFGTSAAAAHAAGTAALVIEALVENLLDARPEIIRQLLGSTSLDMDGPGFDNLTGSGLIQPRVAISSFAFVLDFPVARTDFGNALSFDGINDFILVPPNALHSINDGYTLELWSKFDWNRESDNDLISIITNDGLQFGLSTAGFYSDEDMIFTFKEETDISWHHIVVTVEPNGNATLYVDGIVTDDSQKFYQRSNYTRIFDVPKTLAAAIVKIGSSASNSSFFQGKLDELRIWNYPRTKREINNRKYIPAIGNEDGLVYYYNFNQGIPNENNNEVTNLVDAVSGKDGELLGFDLNGASSNWVRSDVNDANPNVPEIAMVLPGSSIPGKQVILYGANLYNDNLTAYKVTFGSTEAEVTGIYGNIIIATVPEGAGLSKVRVTNWAGSSKPVDFTIISELSQLPFSWKKQTIYSKITPSVVEKGDLNGDGFQDLVVGGTRELVYFQNDGTGKFLTPALVSSSPNITYTDMFLADIDRDGDLDIGCVENGKNFVLFTNDLSTMSWMRIDIMNAGGLNLGIEPIDANGEVDVIIHGSFGILLFKLINGGLSLDREISSNGYHDGPQSLKVFDIYNDGYFEFGAVDLQNNLHVFMNDTFGGFVDFNPSQISGTFNPRVVSSADINNDGQTEIIDIGYDFWFEFLDPADLNGDGYVDLLTAYNSTVVDANWLKNEGGTGSFTANSISFTNGTHDALNVVDGRAVDLDNDGDLDVVTASTQDNRVIAFFHVFSDKDFKTFQLAEQAAGTTTTIDTQSHTIDITVISTANLTKLVPEFTLSLKAIASVGTAPQISNVTIADFNNTGKSLVYTITAEDGSKQNWTVRIHPLPGVTVLNSITAITPTGAKVNLTNGSFTDSNLFEVSTDNFATVINGTSATITGLTAGTTYQVRAKGKNAYGVSEDYSTVLSFITIPSTPVLNTIVNITQTSAIASWPAVAGTDSYKVEVSASGVAFSPYNPIEVTNGNLTITGLTGGVEYKVRVSAVNASGASVYSSQITFVTVPTNPIASAATIVTSNTFVSNWNTVPGASSYEVDLSIDNFATVLQRQTVAATSVTFDNLTSGNNYSYRVRAINSTSLASSNSNIILVVTLPDTPVIDPVSSITQTSANVSWPKITGTDSYRVEVQRDGVAFSPYNPIEITGSTLLINGLSGGIEYKVIVKSVNKSGSSSSSMPVTFVTVPANPIAAAASAVAANTFVSNWNNVPGAASYAVDLSTDNFATVLQTQDASGTSLVFDNLTSGNTYSYRVRAVNSTGLASGNSNFISLSTLPAAPSLDATTAITSTSATLNWQPVNGTTNYQLDLSKDNFSTYVQPYNNFIVGTRTFQLNDLSPGTAYQFRVRSSNASGTSTNFSSSSFITVPSAPVTKAPTTITTTSFIVNWDAVANPSVSGYEVEISADNFTSVLKSENITAGTSAQFIGLTSGTSYSYRVRARNANNLSSSNSFITSVTTLPVKPTVQSVTGISQKGATISWLPVAGATVYQADVSKDNFGTLVVNGQESGATTLVLSDLTAGTSYSVRLRAANAGGASANSDTRVFNTIPPEPIAKEATFKTSASFMANWDASPTATSYSIEISDNNFSTILATTTTSETFSSFTNLTLGKTYSYKVKATNASGTSGYSNAIQVVPTYSVTITSQFFDENTKTASITAISSAGIDSVRLFYRGIASGEYKSVHVPLRSGTTYDILIDSTMQDEMGTEYYFNVKDKLNDQRKGDLSYYYKRIETAERVEIPITRFGRGASNYTLFSVPYQLDDQDMENVFEPVLGSYDDTQWKLVRYLDGRYVDYGSGLNKLEPGKGYWFASLNQVNPQVGSGTVVRANRALAYSLFLQKGWNQVGDPLPFDVSWTDVLDNNKDVKGVGRLYVFEGGAFKRGDLKVWGGGFVKSERDVELKIPVTVKRASSGRSSDTDITNTDISQSAWITPLTIEHGGAVNDLGAFGMHERASMTSDEFDEQSLPRFINYLELNSYHTEYFMPRFMRDIVTTTSSFNWSYVVESNYEDEQATLSWDAAAMGKNEAQLILYDEEGLQLIDMKQRSSYTFKFTGKRSLKFFYAKDKEHMKPDVDGAGLPFPNPFTQHTSIPFVISKANTNVSCTVYDLLGRQVKMLSFEPSESGYHEMEWDGKDSQSNQVAPGVYLYRIRFGNTHTQTGRVILN